MVLIMRYSVEVTIYGDSGEVNDRSTRLFRLRREAEEHSKSVKKIHEIKKISSFVQVKKIDGDEIISKARSKELRKMLKMKR